MNLLAVSNDVFALMFGGVGLLASSLVAFLTFQKGAGGKRSLEADTPWYSVSSKAALKKCRPNMRHSGAN